ncbi:MAG: substrate-binding domain-containing protein [Bacteroidales bacterium]|jgi:ABC-type xylose transport system substrate-binding protein
MKKIYTIVLVVLVSLLNIFRTDGQSNDSLKVGFILANLYHERWWNDKKYFEEKFNEMGGKVEFIDCYDMSSNQVEAAKKFIEEKVSCIVIIPADAQQAKPVVDLAHEAGIPVVAYDRLILGAPLDLYITVNSTTVGELMAQCVVDVMDKGTILYLGGPSEDFNSSFIRDGNFRVLNQHKGQYKIYSEQVSSWNQLDAYLILQDFFSNNNLIPDAIICAADMLTSGAITVLEENNKLGEVFLTGQDAELNICKHLVEGNVLMTVYKSNKELAKVGAETVWKLINGDEFEIDDKINNNYGDIPSILVPPVLVTKETIDKALIEEGIYTHEEIYE